MGDNFYSIGKHGRSELVTSAADWLIVHYYSDLWKVMSCGEYHIWTAFAIDGMKLMATHQVLGNLLLLKSRETMKIFDEALIAAQNDLLTRLAGEEISIHPRLSIRWHHLPNFAETYRSKIPKSVDANKLLMVRGTIVRATPAKLIEWEATYQCHTCHGTFNVPADLESFNFQPTPTACGVSSSLGVKKCTSKKFNKISVVNANNSRDYQELKLQEQVQHLNMGALPRSIGVAIMDNLVGICNAGDDVTVTGLLTHRWGVLAMDEKPELELIILATHITVNNERRTGSSITDDVSREFSHFWQFYGLDSPLLARDAVIRSICPDVYGMRNVKLAIAIILAGGVRVRNGANTTRGDSHLLMVGDPGTGKSQLLRFAAKLANRSVLTTGVGTTAAGLTATAVKDNNGQWGLEAGALVLADGGACCIDEFSSIEKDNLAAIHEAMEQQTVHMSKAGIQCELHTRCSVIAATNPKTKYNAEETISMNVAIDSPVLSRFDLVMVLQDECDDVWDKAISAFILKERTKYIKALDTGDDDIDDEDEAQLQFLNGRMPQTPTTPTTPSSSNRVDTSPNNRSSSMFDDETGSFSAGSHSMGMDHSISSRSGTGRGPHGPVALLNNVWSLEKLQSYLTWIKASFQPKLSGEAQIIGAAYYKRQRQADDLDAARTTTRLAESFVRLAQGHAKLMARHVAVVQDAVIAILLLECSSISWILGGTRVPTVRSFFPLDPDTEYMETEATILKHLGLSHLGSLPPPSTVPSTPLPPPRVSGDQGGIAWASTPAATTPNHRNIPRTPSSHGQEPNVSKNSFFTRPPGASPQSQTILDTIGSQNRNTMDEEFESSPFPTDPRIAPQNLSHSNPVSSKNGFSTGMGHQAPLNQAGAITSIPFVFDDSSQVSSNSMWNTRHHDNHLADHEMETSIPTQRSVVSQGRAPTHVAVSTHHPIANHSSSHQRHLPQYPQEQTSAGEHMEDRNMKSHQHNFSAPIAVVPSSVVMPELVPLPPGMDSDFGVWDMQQNLHAKPLGLGATVPSSQMDLDEDFMM